MSYTLTPEMNEIMLKTFGRELITRMYDKAIIRQKDSKIGEVVDNDTAVEEGLSVLDAMFNIRNDIVVKPSVNKINRKSVEKKKYSTAVSDTSSEEENELSMLEVAQSLSKSKLGRPKNPPPKPPIISDFMANMAKDDPVILIKPSKTEQKNLKKRTKCLAEINKVRLKLTSEFAISEEDVEKIKEPSDLCDVLKDIKKQLKSQKKLLVTSDIKDYTVNRLTDANESDLHGLKVKKDGSKPYLRYKINKITREIFKVNPDNYTEEGNNCFNMLKVKLSEKNSEKTSKKTKEKTSEKTSKKTKEKNSEKPKEKTLKCFRAYNKKDTTSKSITWKRYYEEVVKRTTTETAIFETFDPLNQWKFSTSPGAIADRLIKNPFEVDTHPDDCTEFQDYEDSKPVVEQLTVEDIELEEEESSDEDGEEFTIIGGEDWAHFDLPNHELIKNPNNEVWDKKSKMSVGFYDEKTNHIVDKLSSDSDSDSDSDAESDNDDFTESW